MSRRQSAARFDDEIHGRLRLQLCAALTPVRWAELAVLRELLQVSDSVLSKHLSRLEAVGYVVIDRDQGDARRKAARLTPAGRKAYQGHLAALQAIVGPLPEAALAPESPQFALAPAPKPAFSGG